MPTIVSHAVAATALAAALPASVVPRGAILLAGMCAMAPDADVIGSRFGIRYGDLLGHRGLSHSLAFALCFSFAAWAAVFPSVAGTARRAALLLYLLVATVSHGVLDAFTDGGLGVAFFSPFDPTRYFFRVRPIEVSPIGAAFFSARGLAVLQSEFLWVWLPSVAFVVLAFMLRRALSSREQV